MNGGDAQQWVGLVGGGLAGMAAVTMLLIGWRDSRRRQVEDDTAGKRRVGAPPRPGRPALDEPDDPILTALGLGRGGPVSETEADSASAYPVDSLDRPGSR